MICSRLGSGWRQVSGLDFVLSIASLASHQVRGMIQQSVNSFAEICTGIELRFSEVSEPDCRLSGSIDRRSREIILLGSLEMVSIFVSIRFSSGLEHDLIQVPKIIFLR